MFSTWKYIYIYILVRLFCHTHTMCCCIFYTVRCVLMSCVGYIICCLCRSKAKCPVGFSECISRVCSENSNRILCGVQQTQISCGGLIDLFCLYLKLRAMYIACVTSNLNVLLGLVDVLLIPWVIERLPNIMLFCFGRSKSKYPVRLS